MRFRRCVEIVVGEDTTTHEDGVYTKNRTISVWVYADSQKQAEEVVEERLQALIGDPAEG